MFIDQNGKVYQGDMRLGDRLATAEEVEAYAAEQSAAAKPRVVSMRQARLALLAVGKLQAVNDAVASMAGAEGQAARIEWEYSQEVQRDKALVQSLAPLLGLDAAQLDALFALASTL